MDGTAVSVKPAIDSYNTDKTCGGERERRQLSSGFILYRSAAQAKERASEADMGVGQSAGVTPAYRLIPQGRGCYAPLALALAL